MDKIIDFSKIFHVIESVTELDAEAHTFIAFLNCTNQRGGLNLNRVHNAMCSS